MINNVQSRTADIVAPPVVFSGFWNNTDAEFIQLITAVVLFCCSAFLACTTYSATASHTLCPFKLIRHLTIWSWRLSDEVPDYMHCGRIQTYTDTETGCEYWDAEVNGSLVTTQNLTKRGSVYYFLIKILSRVALHDRSTQVKRFVYDCFTKSSLMKSHNIVKQLYMKQTIYRRTRWQDGMNQSHILLQKFAATVMLETSL